jgi:hypothetical protein
MKNTEAAEFTRNYFELNYRFLAGLFWALFCGLIFFALTALLLKHNPCSQGVPFRCDTDTECTVGGMREIWRG